MPSDIQEAKCFCGETAISFKNDPMMHFMCHYPEQDGLFILVDPNFPKALLSAQPCHYGHRIESQCLAVFPMEIYDL